LKDGRIFAFLFRAKAPISISVKLKWDPDWLIEGLRFSPTLYRTFLSDDEALLVVASRTILTNRGNDPPVEYSEYMYISCMGGADVEGKVGKVARWQGGKVARWQGGKVARWQGGKVHLHR
jgi:hypothetical protein